MALLATTLVALAQLFLVAAKANLSANTTTFATVLAQEKMEQLRGLTWGFDRLSLPVSDFSTDITLDPAVPDAGVGLTPSPANSLTSNVPGYVDYLDRFGQSLGGGANPPANTLFVRRWSIEPLPTNPNNTLIFQVFVYQIGGRGDNLTDGEVVEIMPDESRLATVKTRKSP